MITGEDYNLAPLTSSQNILKIKAVNRTSSGISRNFEILDATGKYSSINIFADDGYIYKEESEKNLSFKFASRIEIINFIRRTIKQEFSSTEVYNFYLTKFDKTLFTDENSIWQGITDDVNLSTGYFKNAVDGSLLKVGTYSTSTLKYLSHNSLIKFVPPAGKAFKKGQLVLIDNNDPLQTDRLWTKVIQVVGDGTNSGRGALSTGLGPISFSDTIPTGSIAKQVVSKFVNDLSVSVEEEIVNQMYQNFNFGLRYDALTTTWKIITSSNIDLIGDFSLGKSGDTTNSNLDSSWIIAFVKDADEYIIRIRNMNYVFGSVSQNRFYFDSNEKSYNDKLGKVVKDQIKILAINTSSNLLDVLKQDFSFEVNDTIKFDDGYESNKEVKIAFSDSDDDLVIDNPESFEQVVGVDLDLNYLFFEELVDDSGSTYYALIDNTNDTILVRQKESGIVVSDFADGQLIYFYDSNENRIKKVNLASNSLIYQPQYKAVIGRDNLKFQYIHTASSDRRIDPSTSNIIDIYLLTRAYDVDYRNYLLGLSNEPEIPTSDDLRIAFGTKLNSIKSISDEIIYHPVSYKVLFGSNANPKLQATFKVVKNPNKAINDNDLKVRIITAINEFFDVNNWDFGDRFYLSEMITYVINSVSPDVSNIVILPRQTTQAFGSLFEIQSKPNELFISGATVDDIEIVSAITAAEVRATSSTIITST